MTPILLQTELRIQETIKVARMIFRSLFPVTATIFFPMASVMPVWNKDEPTIIMPASRMLVLLS